MKRRVVSIFRKAAVGNLGLGKNTVVVSEKNVKDADNRRKTRIATFMNTCGFGEACRLYSS